MRGLFFAFIPSLKCKNSRETIKPGSLLNYVFEQ